jgi:hypothetical protein
LTLKKPLPIARDVEHNPPEPGLQTSLTTKALPPAQGEGETFLDNVESCFAVTDERGNAA